jgi:hypothetical protein
MRKDQETEQQKQTKQERAELEAFRQDKLTEAIGMLLKDENFRLVMSEILAKGKMFHTVMTGNSFTFHTAGRQDYAKEIFSFLAKVDFDSAFNLLKTQSVNLE